MQKNRKIALFLRYLWYLFLRRTAQFKVFFVKPEQTVSLRSAQFAGQCTCLLYTSVCIDDPQKIALADAVIFHYDLAVTGQALGLHGFQRAAAEHGLLVQNGADVHQAAGAEEHFHGR